MAGGKHQTLPTIATTYEPVSSSSSRVASTVKKGCILLGALGAICFLHHHSNNRLARGVREYGMDDLLHWSDSKSASEVCPQAVLLVPRKNNDLWVQIGETYGSDVFKARAVEWLGGAVRVPTESFNYMDPPGVDPRWLAFGPFHDYLLTAFPQIHATLELTKVNTYGLLYHWKGSDPSLKPLLLAAHQDVVPVDPRSMDEWEHPPYSGFFDGELIWGRGSNDDKSGLIGTMSAIETLLEKGFKPRRSVILSFGFDEEVGGVYGARALSEALMARFGKHSIAMIMDEGGGISEQFGAVMAVPAIAEKGYLDVRVEVASPGGHSSIPPPHTSIGMLASLLVEYETHPHTIHLERGTPMFGLIQCIGEHAPALPETLRKAIKKSSKSDKALRTVEAALFQDKMIKSVVGTTQAIDMIQGGVKTNALPEQAWAVVNHRIATQSSVGAIKEHNVALLEVLASKYNLTFEAFGKTISGGDGVPAYGSLTLSDAWGTALEPAPVTPTSADDAPYQLLSGTIKATYDAHHSLKNEKQLPVAPGIRAGNTDTRYYWDLTEHIFRYSHRTFRADRVPGIHTVNEFMEVDSLIEMIRFYATLILNADESDALS